MWHFEKKILKNLKFCIVIWINIPGKWLLIVYVGRYSYWLIGWTFLTLTHIMYNQLTLRLHGSQMDFLGWDFPSISPDDWSTSRTWIDKSKTLFCFFPSQKVHFSNCISLQNIPTYLACRGRPPPLWYICSRAGGWEASRLNKLRLGGLPAALGGSGVFLVCRYK